MSVNKWRDSNIYGNFKNKDLLTSASNTTVVTPASAEFDGNVIVNGILHTYGTDNIFDGPINGSIAEFTGNVTANVVNANVGISCNGYITGNTLQSSTTIVGGSLQITADGVFDGNLTCDNMSSNSMQANIITGLSADFTGNVTANGILHTYGTDNIFNGPIHGSSADFTGNVTANGILHTYGTDNIFNGPIHGSSANFNGNLSVSVDGTFHTYGPDNFFDGTIFGNVIQSTNLGIISNGKIKTYNQSTAPGNANMIGCRYEQILTTEDYLTLTTDTDYSFTGIVINSADQYGMYQLNVMVYIKSDTTSSDTTNLSSYDIFVNGCTVVPRFTALTNIGKTGTKNVVIMSCPLSMTLAIYANTTITLKVNCSFTKTGSGTINLGPNSYIQLTKIA